ncbi:MAG: hypothetical protein Q9168_001057 [Polycauliona sp. 1 TL-2023]
MSYDPALPPAIPPRTSVRTPRKSRRRCSLPDNSSTSTVVQRPPKSPNSVTIKPASPEVITSLICSLGAISSLTESHCGTSSDIHHTHSTPRSPLLNHSDFLSPSFPRKERPQPCPKSPTGIAFGMGYGAADYLNLSPRVSSPAPTSMRSSRSHQELRSRLRLRPTEDDDDARSIGQVSIEPAPWQSSTSLVSAGSGHAGQPRVGLGIRGPTSSSKKRSNPERQPTDCVDRAIDLIPTSPRDPSSGSTTTAGQYPNDPTGSPVVGNGHIIPSRESSLRHSFAASSSHRKRRSRRSNDSSAAARSPSIDEHRQPSKCESPEGKSVDTVDDEVTRRIKELKDQKRLRDISFTVTTPDLMPPTPQMSRSPSPLRLVHDPNGPLDHLDSDLAKTIGETWKETLDENSAPSPAVVQRVDRKGKRNSIGGKPFANTHFSAVRPAEPNRTQSTPVQRSNSKLLRRLSRPTSPATAEKHRRTFSGIMAEQLGVMEPESVDPIDDAVLDYLSAARLTQRTTHPETGRVISFSEVGDPEGSVVFCCVGMGLTRHITAFYDDLAKTLKLRLITPDRPGVGGSEMHADGLGTPLGWPDDVLAICQKLKITKFSLLAHSAGAIYALATALRLPQQIRGRIHLLAPWIPPSQMSGIGTQQESLPVSALPLSQRLLQSLPTTFLKAANSNYLRTTSASITTSLPKSPRRLKPKGGTSAPRARSRTPNEEEPLNHPKSRNTAIRQDPPARTTTPMDDSDSAASFIKPANSSEKERQSTYDSRLTGAIWDASTTGANPAVDLLVCLERKQPIGFRYVDITRSVIIHHGSKDTRVPIENIKWLGQMMRRCEVRVLDGEGHGLMASAVVMSNILMEIAKEWEDWIRVVQGKGNGNRRQLSP